MSVHVIATGGTISSHLTADGWANLDGASLVAELGALPVEVTVADVASGPSSNLSVDDMVAVAHHIAEALERGADGVVVLHGTDTMELGAFVAQLMLGTAPARRPVVFTGAMRVHSHPDPDGGRNLRDAITVAASASAIGSDVLVCMDGTLHAAQRVNKVSAASLDAFDSSPFPEVGAVRGDSVVLHEAAAALPCATSLRGPVPLFSCYPGVLAAALDSALVDAVGVVVEGFGDLNLPRAVWAPLHRASQAGVLVVVASRPYTPTTATEGLAALGAIGAGGLTAQKARLAAMAALGSHRTRDEAIAFFHRYSMCADAGERSTQP